MNRNILVAFLSAALMAGMPAMAQEYGKDKQGGSAADRDKDKNVTYGRIKELKEGQQVKIDIPRAMDKSYDLNKNTDKQQVVMESGLKVGDEVAIREENENGRKVVHIDKHAGAMAAEEREQQRGAVRTDEADRSAAATGAAAGAGKERGRDRNMTYGSVKEFKEGDEITIAVPNAVDKTYKLNDKDEHVVVAAGLKPGDEVVVRETERSGMKMVHIDKRGARHPARTDEPGGAGTKPPRNNPDK